MKPNDMWGCHGNCNQGRTCTCCDGEGESPQWFEFVLYVIRSVLSGIGILAVIFFLGYWSTL